MKKLIMPITVIATIIASFANMQNLINKKLNDNPTFQLQIIVNNQTSDINGQKIFVKKQAWFYLDLSIDNITYNDNNFIHQNINNSDFKSNFHSDLGSGNIYNYPDVFWTTPSSELTLYTITFNAIKSIDNTYINFTFGIFADNYHYQNTQANNYQYNFRKTYFNTKNNGTKIVINANGGWGTNTANWAFQYYKF